MRLPFRPRGQCPRVQASRPIATDRAEAEKLDCTWVEALVGTACLYGALVGRVDEGPPFCLGDDVQAVMPADGRLQLGFNDGGTFEDNAGYWSIAIERAGELCASVPLGVHTPPLPSNTASVALMREVLPDKPWGGYVLLTTYSTDGDWIPGFKTEVEGHQSLGLEGLVDRCRERDLRLRVKRGADQRGW